ncbi:MAG: hypothetical protein ABIK19_01845 [candidate division WOR-3 bacterium]
MAHKKDQKFRISKINILKAIARRPKGMLRPTKVHKVKTIYSRQQQKQEFIKIKKEEVGQ